MRGLYTDVYGPEQKRVPTAEEWAAFTASCSLRDMGYHVCALPTGWNTAPRAGSPGLQPRPPKKSAAATFRRMLASHKPEPSSEPAEEASPPAARCS